MNSGSARTTYCGRSRSSTRRRYDAHHVRPSPRSASGETALEPNGLPWQPRGPGARLARGERVEFDHGGATGQRLRHAPHQRRLGRAQHDVAAYSVARDVDGPS